MKTDGEMEGGREGERGRGKLYLSPRPVQKHIEAPYTVKGAR